MYQPIFKHVLFPIYEALVRGRATSTYLRQYNRSQWQSPQDVERLQLEKLNQLLSHAWSEVPFLNEYWRASGCRPGALRSVRELELYPILTKQLISANYDRMIARSWHGKTLRKTTGGSTGEPFQLEYTAESYARRTAVMWRGYRWAGADLGTRTAYLWGTGKPQEGWRGLKDRLYHHAFNRKFLDAFSITDQSIATYVSAITRYHPEILVGYVAPVVLVARWINERGVKISGVKGVITGAEALFEPDRLEIERAFGCKVFNTYGCREFMLMAAECELHSGLHVSADHLVLETVDTRGRGVTGEPGDVAVTDLHNYGMPFVRYKNGDRATYSAELCKCGRGLPLLGSVDGRILDSIRTVDGRYVPGEFFVYVLLPYSSIKQYLVVQTAIDEIQVQIVSSRPIGDVEREQLKTEIQRIVGPATRIRIEDVEEIPPSRSGKRRVTTSLVAERS